MQESSLVAWVHDPLMPNSTFSASEARKKACTILSLLQYQSTQAPREIILCPGFIGASIPTLKLAMQVNECKERFKKSVLALKNDKLLTRNAEFTDKMNSIITRHFGQSNVLAQMGLSRLHLKQCYRKIPILEKAPHKISWTWAHTRAIKQITISKAQEMLLKKGTDIGIEIQLSKLSALSPNEMLAIVQELAPHLRANLVFKQNDQVVRKMIKGPIPIFFPSEPNSAPPLFSAPSEKCEKDKNRLKRSDERLDTVAFLPAIRAHRYLVKESPKD
ncbi:MAG: DNA replication terminus site-binding family protein [Proteobacteria bacterium]|nr:DNA replication terminus site-binding family protein [Pseudomonadota bacterium]